jgi:hypothetical protein
MDRSGGEPRDRSGHEEDSISSDSNSSQLKRDNVSVHLETASTVPLAIVQVIRKDFPAVILVVLGA